MLRSLSGEYLASALDGFEGGELRAAAKLWSSMAQRDDVISCVKPKREKSISRRDWQVLTKDNSADALRQKAILEDFWNNIKAVDAYDLNKRGGFAMLVRQMMASVSFMYQPHHLVWQPSTDVLRCTFEAVPLEFCENLTGRLRFCPTGMEYEGVEMPDEEWMVTCGDGLMIAGSIAYFCKRNSLADWMAFSDKFGMPGILARTSQGKDTPGGQAMAEAAECFGQEWAAVMYGDDGSGKIDLIEASGGASLPFEPLIKRVDSRLMSMWRGGDLGTQSSTKGEGTGASLQGSETDLIEQDDALTISEKLNEIEEIVLRWWFGPRVKVKAYIRLIVPQSEDLSLLLSIVETLVRLGAPVAVNDVLERFGLAQPAKDALLLKATKAATAKPGQKEDPEEEIQPQLNAGLSDEDEEIFLANAGRLLAKASLKDRENLVGAMKAVLSTPEHLQLNALVNFLERLPNNIGQDSAQVKAWERLLSTALVNGWAIR